MQRLLNGVFLVLLSCSLGLHWAALQGVAWTSMLIERVPATGWIRALETTFDGKHPCRLCREVTAGHAKSGTAEMTSLDQRFDLIPSVVVPWVLIAPQLPEFSPATGFCWIRRPMAPDVPPPRGLLLSV